jgi:NAD(P)-dependent dehydrogenase (short-subunit alcohol dehydrogenase family)
MTTNPVNYRGRVVAGADVAVCARAKPETPATAVGHTAVFLSADLRDAAQAQAPVGQLGRLDVLVNSAGGSPNAAAAAVSPRYGGFRYVDNMRRIGRAWGIAERRAVREWTRSDAGRYIEKESVRPSLRRDADDLVLRRVRALSESSP